MIRCSTHLCDRARAPRLAQVHAPTRARSRSRLRARGRRRACEYVCARVLRMPGLVFACATARVRARVVRARIRLRTASPLLVDDYRRNRTTGSFVLIDPNSNLTVAAGFIS